MNKMLPYEIGHSVGVLLTYRGENTQQKFALNWSITFPIQPIVNKISIKCINFHQFINTIQFDIEKIHRDLFNAYVHTYVCIKRSTSVVYCMTSGKYVIVIKFEN